MAFIQKLKRKSGTSYRIRYRLNGKEHAHDLPLGTTYPEAKAITQKYNHEIALHKAGIKRFQNPLEPHKSTNTIRDFQEWFLQNKKTAIRKGRPIAKRTTETYIRAFRFLIDSIGNIPIGEIARHLPEIEERLQHYAPTTRSILIRSLRAAWSFGRKRKKLDSNPFSDIEITKEQKIPDVLTVEEKDRIFEKIQNREAKIAFALARYAGIRREEICKNIRWQDILWDENMINIPRAKTGENQRVPMVPALKSILIQFKQPEGFYVTLHPDTLTHALGKAKREAGVKKDGAVHILRHSLGTDLIEDFDLREVQDILRHTSLTTT